MVAVSSVRYQARHRDEELRARLVELGSVNTIGDGGDENRFSQDKERRARRSRSTEATSDVEMRKTGPVPTAYIPARKNRVPGALGCGGNRLILRCRPRLGMAKAFILRLV